MTERQHQSRELAAKLLYLQSQENSIKQEIREIKNQLENLYAENAIPAKDDLKILYSDGEYRKIRLQRQKTGTYFKVKEEYKEEFSEESHSLQTKYLIANKAEMAEKACTWKVQEVK